MTERQVRGRRPLTAAAALLLAMAACAAPIDTDPPPNGDPPNGDPPPSPLPEAGAWYALPRAGVDRQEVSFVQVDGLFYLAGGSTQHEVYDPLSEQWSQAASLPGWRDHVQGVTADGLIYYIGGLTGWPGPHSTDVLIYDPQANDFGSGSPMPRGRGAGGVAEHDGLIYYAGGLHDGQAVPWFDVYDPASGEWQELPDMPLARDHFHAAVVEGVFYVIGGRDTTIDAVTDQVDAFEIATGMWSTLDTALPTPRGGFAAAVLGSEILIIGGEGGGQTFAEVEAFDTVTRTWRTLAPMLTPRHGIQAAVCDGGVYVAAGGETQGGGDPSSVHEVFFLGEPTPCGAGSFASIAWTTVANALEPGRMEAQGLAAQGRLYVFGGYTSWSPDPLCTTTHSMAYDPAIDEWLELAPMPEPWTHAGAVYDGGNIYLAGGRANDEECTAEESSHLVLRYDIAEDAWFADVPPLPGARSSGGFVKLGRNLHFFGGVSHIKPDVPDDDWAERPHHWVLSLDGGTEWETLAPVPEPRSHLAAVAVGGVIYAIGGQLDEGGSANTLAFVHRYDPVTDQWSEVTELPAPLSHMTASTLVARGRILVLGGERAHGQPVNEVLVYVPGGTGWSLLSPLPETRRSGVAGLIDGRIYYATGGGHFSTTTYQGTPQE